MIEGSVNAAYEAVVILSLQGSEGRTRDIEAVIDTGYTGTLTLPTAVVADLGLSFSHMGWAFLANGRCCELRRSRRYCTLGRPTETRQG